MGKTKHESSLNKTREILMGGEKNFRCDNRATRNGFELCNYILISLNLVLILDCLIASRWFIQDVAGVSKAHGVGLFQYCHIPDQKWTKDTCYHLGTNNTVPYGFELEVIHGAYGWSYTTFIAKSSLSFAKFCFISSALLLSISIILPWAVSCQDRLRPSEHIERK